jgi:hypothetical protein
MPNNKKQDKSIFGLALEYTTYIGLIVSVILALMYLFCEQCREGVVKLFGALPIHIALIFVIFVCVAGIVFIINHVYKLNQNKKARRDNLGYITTNGVMKNKVRANLPPIECLGCGHRIKLPKRITSIENYDGHITCKKCWALLAIEKVGNEIPRYKLIKEGKGRPIQEIKVVYDGDERDSRLSSKTTQT